MKRKNVKAMAGVIITSMAVSVLAYAGLSRLATFETKEDQKVTAHVSMAAPAEEVLLKSASAGIGKYLGNINSDKNTDTAAAALLTAAAKTAENPDTDAQKKEAESQKEAERQKKVAEWENRAIASNVEEYVYIRESASTDSEIVGRLPRGGAGDVIEEGEEFTRISSGSVEGYVSNSYLATGEEALEVAEAVCDTVAVAESDLISVRTEPDAEAEIMQTADEGESFKVVEEDADWVTVAVGETKGYMSKSVVTVKLLTKEAEMIEKETPKPEEKDTLESPESSGKNETAGTQSSSKASGSKSDSKASDTSAESTESSASAGGSHSATFKVTAYCSCSSCCGGYANGITASGTTCTAGRTIAVDSSVIPLGTTVYINGQAYVAEDTGVSGHTIDLYMDSHSAALNWGVQYLTVTW